MMNIRNKSVNVERTKLLEALKTNLELHRAQYKEAVADFQARLLKDLTVAKNKVKKANPESLKDFRFDINFPANHEKDFVEVIDMLEHSTDETINLDSESFKAYFKNEWSWTHSFETSLALYKSGTFIGVNR
jgi:hypothetical protein